MFDTIKKDIISRMDSSIQSFKSDMQGIRAGRASPSMLDSIKIDAYGQKMNINQLGNITTPGKFLQSVKYVKSINFPLATLSVIGGLIIKSFGAYSLITKQYVDYAIPLLIGFLKLTITSKGKTPPILPSTVLIS